MPATQSLLREPVVLIVHVNFAVAISVAQRLMESCLVTLAPTALAATGIGRLDACDVVVLCPYLTAEERELLLAACAAHPSPPAVVEIFDCAGGGEAPVRVVALPGERRPPAQTVLTALSPLAS